MGLLHIELLDLLQEYGVSPLDDYKYACRKSNEIAQAFNKFASRYKIHNQYIDRFTIKDMLIQRYIDSSSWLYFDESDEKEVVDYIVSYLTMAYKRSDYMRLFYARRHICEKILQKAVIFNQFEHILEEVVNNPCLIAFTNIGTYKIREVGLILYNLLTFIEHRKMAQPYVFKYIFVDYNANLYAACCSSNVLDKLDDLIRNRFIEVYSFRKILENAVKDPHTVINKELLDFTLEESRYSLLALATVLRPDIVNHFFNNKERKKHFERFLKLFLDESTRTTMNLDVCKTKEEQNALNGIIFLKNL